MAPPAILAHLLKVPENCPRTPMVKRRSALTSPVNASEREMNLALSNGSDRMWQNHSITFAKGSGQWQF